MMWIAVLISKFSEIPSSTREAFNNKSRIIEDIFNMNLALKKVKIKGVRKVSITLESDAGINSISPPLKGFSPVVNVRRSYDFHLFVSLTEHEQNVAILDLIESSIYKAAVEFGWDTNVFLEIANEVRKSNFKQSYIEGKIKPSKNKELKAGVEVDMQPGYVVISTVFYSANDSLLKRVELIKVRPDRMFIKPFIGLTKWLNNKEFLVTNKEGEIHFKASLESDKAEIYFTPMSRTQDELIDDLLISSVTTNKEQAMELLKEKIRKATS